MREELEPNCPAQAVKLLESIEPSSTPVVVCTHGEVIDYIQRHLRGANPPGFGPDQPGDKGSRWILQLDNGAVAFAQYLPPTSSLAASKRPMANRPSAAGLVLRRLAARQRGDGG
jgi:broad specificity phosphatase PhoE